MPTRPREGRRIYVFTTADGSERTIEFFKSWAQQIQNLLEKLHRKTEVTRQRVRKNTEYFLFLLEDYVGG
jgi:hypothetical protein